MLEKNAGRIVTKKKKKNTVVQRCSTFYCRCLKIQFSNENYYNSNASNKSLHMWSELYYSKIEPLPWRTERRRDSVESESARERTQHRHELRRDCPNTQMMMMTMMMRAGLQHSSIYSIFTISVITLTNSVTLCDVFHLIISCSTKNFFI